MKCTECGTAMTKTVGDHVYSESGMDHVILRNVATFTCPKDGKKFVQIYAMAQLHRAIAQAIAEKPARLIPSEVRFIRDHLGLTNRAFAALMGVSPEQSSRWTTSDQISVQAERFLRVLATLGPELVRPVEADAGADIEPAEDSLGIGYAEEALKGVTRVLHHLPPPSAEAKLVKIGLRRAGASGWKQDCAMTN